MRGLGIPLLLAAWALQAPLVAGVVVELETRELGTEQAQPTRSRIAIEGQLVRVDMVPEGGSSPRSSMIYRGDRGEMLILDHASRRVMRMDRQKAEQMAGQMGQAMKQLEERMASMPPEMQEMVKKKLQQPGTPRAVEVRATSERRTVHERDCLRYDVLRDGEKVREHWVTDWKSYGLSRESFAVFEDMGAFLDKAFESLRQGGAQGVRVGEMAELPGLPVVTREFEDGEPTDETILASAREAAVDPATFEVPQGYEEQKLELPSAAR